MAYFTEAEMDVWYQSLPSMPVGAKILFTDSAGKVLIVKPNYRPGWQLVGGVVENDESPLQAAIREAKEEIGLTITSERLTFKGVGYESPRQHRPGVLCVVFAATLTPDEVSHLTLQSSELHESKFVNAESLPSETDNPALRDVIAIHKDHATSGYVEDSTLKVRA